jgi:ABC-type dipeptide/oligopeptide/nickel transport system ATPase component
MISTPLLSIRGLAIKAGSRTIIENASFDIHRHEIVALVGESGSGKSMIARTIMGIPPAQTIRTTAGQIVLHNDDLLTLPERTLQALRGREFAYIPQSPLNALNPLMTIGRQLCEAYAPYDGSNTTSAKDRAMFLLVRVGFLQPELVLRSYPYQLSGGMRQRVLIAMALMNSPRLLIADEPTTALDVTLQAEILNLLLELKHEYGLGILLITHDLGIVARVANKVVILRHGITIEQGSVDDIFYRPCCDYTKMLLGSILPHPLEQTFWPKRPSVPPKATPKRPFFLHKGASSGMCERLSRLFFDFAPVY